MRQDAVSLDLYGHPDEWDAVKDGQSLCSSGRWPSEKRNLDELSLPDPGG